MTNEEIKLLVQENEKKITQILYETLNTVNENGFDMATEVRQTTQYGVTTRNDVFGCTITVMLKTGRFD